MRPEQPWWNDPAKLSGLITTLAFLAVAVLFLSVSIRVAVAIVGWGR